MCKECWEIFSYITAQHLCSITECLRLSLHGIPTHDVTTLLDLDPHASKVVEQTVDRFQNVLSDITHIHATQHGSRRVAAHDVFVQSAQLTPQAAIFEFQRMRSEGTDCCDVIGRTCWG